MQTLLDKLMRIAQELPREEVERLIRHAEAAAFNLSLTRSLTRRRETSQDTPSRQAVQL